MELRSRLDQARKMMIKLKNEEQEHEENPSRGKTSGIEEVKEITALLKKTSESHQYRTPSSSRTENAKILRIRQRIKPGGNHSGRINDGEASLTCEQCKKWENLVATLREKLSKEESSTVITDLERKLKAKSLELEAANERGDALQKALNSTRAELMQVIDRSSSQVNPTSAPSELLRKLNALTKELERERHEAIKATKQAQAAQFRASALQMEVTRLSGLNKERLQEIRRIREKQQSEQQNARMAKHMVEEMRLENTQLQNSLDKTRAQQETTAKELQNEYERSQRSKEQLEAQKDALEIARNDLASVRTSAQEMLALLFPGEFVNDVDDIPNTMFRIERGIEGMVSNCIQVRKEVDEQRKAYDEAEIRANNAHDLALGRHAEIQTILEDLQTKDAEILRQRRNLTLLNQELEEKQHEVAQMRSQTASLEENLGMVSQDYQALNLEIQDLRRAFALAETRSREDHQCLESLKAEMINIDSIKMDRERQAQRLADRVQVLENELSEAKKKENELDERLREAHEQFHEIESENQALAQANDRLKGNVILFGNRLLEASFGMQSLQRELKESKRAIRLFSLRVLQWAKISNFQILVKQVLGARLVQARAEIHRLKSEVGESDAATRVLAIRLLANRSKERANNAILRTLLMRLLEAKVKETRLRSLIQQLGHRFTSSRMLLCEHQSAARALSLRLLEFATEKTRLEGDLSNANAKFFGIHSEVGQCRDNLSLISKRLLDMTIENSGLRHQLLESRSIRKTQEEDLRDKTAALNTLASRLLDCMIKLELQQSELNASFDTATQSSEDDERYRAQALLIENLSAKLSNCERQVNYEKSRNARLTRMMSEENALRSDLLAKHQAQRLMLEESRQALSRTRDEAHQLKLEVGKLEHTNSETTQTLEKQRKEHAKACADLSKTAAVLEQELESNKAMADILEQVRRKNEELEGELREKGPALDECRNQLEESHRHLQTSLKQLDTARKSLEAKQNEFQTYQDQAEAERQRLAMVGQSEVQVYHTKYIDQSRKLREAQTENERLHTELCSAKASLRALESREKQVLPVLEQELEVVQARFVQAQKCATQLEQSLGIAIRAKGETEHELKNTTEELEACKDHIAVLERANDSLRGENDKITGLVHEIAMVNEKCKAFERTVERLRPLEESVSQKQQLVEKLLKRVNRCADENKALTYETKTLETELSRWKRDVVPVFMWRYLDAQCRIHRLRSELICTKQSAVTLSKKVLDLRENLRRECNVSKESRMQVLVLSNACRVQSLRILDGAVNERFNKREMDAKIKALEIDLVASKCALECFALKLLSQSKRIRALNDSLVKASHAGSALAVIGLRLMDSRVEIERLRCFESKFLSETKRRQALERADATRKHELNRLKQTCARLVAENDQLVTRDADVRQLESEMRDLASKLRTEKEELKRATEELRGRCIQLRKSEESVQRRERDVELKNQSVDNRAEAIKQVQSLNAQLRVKDNAYQVLEREYNQLVVAQKKGSSDASALEQVARDGATLLRNCIHEKALLVELVKRHETEARKLLRTVSELKEEKSKMALLLYQGVERSTN